jgi:hypothetical protein
MIGGGNADAVFEFEGALVVVAAVALALASAAVDDGCPT